MEGAAINCWELKRGVDLTRGTHVPAHGRLLNGNLRIKIPIASL